MARYDEFLGTYSMLKASKPSLWLADGLGPVRERVGALEDSLPSWREVSPNDPASEGANAVGWIAFAAQVGATIKHRAKANTPAQRKFYTHQLESEGVGEAAGFGAAVGVGEALSLAGLGAVNPIIGSAALALAILSAAQAKRNEDYRALGWHQVTRGVNTRFGQIPEKEWVGGHKRPPWTDDFAFFTDAWANLRYVVGGNGRARLPLHGPIDPAVMRAIMNPATSSARSYGFFRMRRNGRAAMWQYVKSTSTVPGGVVSRTIGPESLYLLWEESALRGRRLSPRRYDNHPSPHSKAGALQHPQRHGDIYSPSASTVKRNRPYSGGTSYGHSGVPPTPPKKKTKTTISAQARHDLIE
jgi:hypothetical protein